MRTKILKIYNYILCFSLLEALLIAKSTNAFIPRVNEPNQQELESTSIQIGRTAIQLIQLGQNDEAIKILSLAVKLNPKEVDLWTSLAEAQVRSKKNYQALSSLNQAIQLKPGEQSTYFRKASVYMNLNDPKKAKISIKKGLSIN